MCNSNICRLPPAEQQISSHRIWKTPRGLHPGPQAEWSLCLYSSLLSFLLNPVSQGRKHNLSPGGQELLGLGPSSSLACKCLSTPFLGGGVYGGREWVWDLRITVFGVGLNSRTSSLSVLISTFENISLLTPTLVGDSRKPGDSSSVLGTQ